jgi:hypothetical protein
VTKECKPNGNAHFAQGGVYVFDDESPWCALGNGQVVGNQAKPNYSNMDLF